MPDGDAHPRLHVGDHVRDRDAEGDDDSTLLVAALHATRAEHFTIDDDGTTVADVNPDYPPEEKVVSVTYPKRSDMRVDDAPKYAFPRSRLALETPIHGTADWSGDGGGS